MSNFRSESFNIEKLAKLKNENLKENYFNN